MQSIFIQPMNEEAFSPYGDVIDFKRDPSYAINNGMCDRYHGVAHPIVIDDNDNAHPAISLGCGKPYELPLRLEMMERHPLGSQAFMPLEPNPFLVIVAPDVSNTPGTPVAFITEPGQGVNYHHNIWHAVLTPLKKRTNFIIIDRYGEGNNLEEYFFETPYIVTAE